MATDTMPRTPGTPRQAPPHRGEPPAGRTVPPGRGEPPTGRTVPPDRGGPAYGRTMPPGRGEPPYGRTHEGRANPDAPSRAWPGPKDRRSRRARPVDAPRHTRPVGMLRPRPAPRPTRPTGPARPAGPAGPRPRPRHPRAPFILLLVGLLGGALISLLVISTTLAQGSFQITNLQQQNTNLARQEQLLSQQVAQAESPAEIAQEAEQFGMQQNPNLRFINLKTGKIVTGKVSQADAAIHVPGVTP